MRLVTIPTAHAISSIRPELKSRGLVFIAEDRRGQYQFVGQTAKAIMHAMEQLCNERKSKSVVSDIARRGDCTGSFRIFKLTRDEAVPYLRKTRASYANLVVATRVPMLYKLTAI